MPDKGVEKVKPVGLTATLAALLGLQPESDNPAATLHLDTLAVSELQIEQDFFSQLMFPLETKT